MKTQPVVSRRSFSKSSAVAAFTFNIVPRHVLGGEGQTPPSDKITLAGIGVGGVGHAQVKSCAETGFQIAALCDVDDLHAKKTFDRFPQARRYRDFRELLASEGDKIDAVYCGTPDHSHAIITLAALRAKKHVCCVKPLTRTVEECRAVFAAAKTAGTATQVTTRPNTNEEGCRTTELIAAGAIGAVREVHVWSYRPVWPQGMPGRPSGEDPVPDTLDWKLWIGPAAMRPFKNEWPEGNPIPDLPPKNWGGRKVYHPFNFRGWWDFGTGALGDMGCHYLNTPYRALKLGYPARVSASTSRRYDESFPLASIVTYDYPAREGLPETRVVWYDGGLRPPKPREMSGDLPDEGVLYIGDEGKMVFQNILDPARAEKFASVPKTLPRRPGTWGEWLTACKGGERAGCDFAWSGPLTEFVLLGDIALRTGKPIDFDAAAVRITNAPEADALLRQPYHNGWSLG
jgi:predicted dehydrogenase